MSEKTSAPAWTQMFIVLLALAACDPQRESPSTSKPAASQPQTPPEPTPTDPQPSVSTELADMYLGLVQDSNMRPGSNAVDTYAKAFGWKATPPEMNALLNAERGYFGTVAGTTVLLGSDGTNDIFSLAVREDFDSAAILASVRKAVTARKVGAEESMGQVFEMYQLADGTTNLGYLSLAYGNTPTIRGTGTIGYISAARARAEGIGGN